MDKSEILEMRDELGFMEPTLENMGRLISIVMDLCNEVDCLRRAQDEI